MGGLGDAIATLDGVNLGALAPVRTETLSPVPVPAAPVVDGESLINGDAEFLAYMNHNPRAPDRRNVIDPGEGALYTGGSSWTPGIPMTPSSAGLAGGPQIRNRSRPMARYAGESYAGENYVGGSTYFPGAALYSNAGLAGDMALLEHQAVVSRQVQQRGTREQVIGPHWGDTYTGGGTYFPGAPLYSNAGLAAATAGTPGAPRTVSNGEMRPIFDSAQSFNDFVKIGGEGVLNRLKTAQAQAARKNSPNLKAVTAQLAAVRLFRTRLFTARGGILPPWKRAEVIDQWIKARRDSTTTAQLQGMPGLHGLNMGLEGLEGRLGRKIRKKMKKGLKTMGKAGLKLAKSGVKMGLRMSTGGIIPI